MFPCHQVQPTSPIGITGIATGQEGNHPLTQKMMLQNLKCQNCGEVLHNTDFFCSLRCAAENFGMKCPDQPDEKIKEIENNNSDLLSNNY